MLPGTPILRSHGRHLWRDDHLGRVRAPVDTGKVMLAHPGRLLTRGRLLRAVWGTAYADEGHYLHVYVSRLRRKLGDADPSGRARDLIVAEPGVGYRVREAEPDDEG